MAARWLWLSALASPLLAGLFIVVLYPSDTMAGAVVFAGWPLTALAAGAAVWSGMSGTHWIAKALGAVTATIAMFLFVAPLLFFASYLLSVFLVGDDSRTYF